MVVVVFHVSTPVLGSTLITVVPVLTEALAGFSLLPLSVAVKATACTAEADNTANNPTAHIA